VGIDECLNHLVIHQLGRKLVEQELAYAWRTLWYQFRQKEDGSHSGHEIGVPIKHWSWSDEEVAAMLISLFGSADRVVLLSENTRRNQGGLRQILQTEIAPVLKTQRAGKLSLLAIFKKGKTDISQFAIEVETMLTSYTFTSGFAELLV
jgi:hypothetical protein